MRALVIFVVAWALLSVTALADTLTGRVVSVVDGDTIRLLDDSGTLHKVRLYGIDAPESSQDYGKSSQKMLATMIASKDVSIETAGTDKYGREIGTIYLNGVSVNEAMVKSGYAWVYTQYCKEAAVCDRMISYQQFASKSRKGLWEQPNAMPPWEWRHGKVNTEQVSSIHSEIKERSQPRIDVASAGTLHGNTNSHIYHNSGCRYYDCKNCTRSFSSSEEARNAGYRACKKCGG